MDTVLLLLFVSAMSLIAAVFVFGSRSRKTGTSKPKRSSNKARRTSTSARKKSKQKKSATRRKARQSMDNEELYDMFIDTLLSGRNKDR